METVLAFIALALGSIILAPATADVLKRQARRRR
jgi:hypothetical protein